MVRIFYQLHFLRNIDNHLEHYKNNDLNNNNIIHCNTASKPLEEHLGESKRNDVETRPQCFSWVCYSNDMIVLYFN